MTTDAHRLPDTLLAWSALRHMVGLCRTTVWSLRRQGRFPQPRKIGSRQFWLASEIAAWQAALPKAGMP